MLVREERVATGRRELDRVQDRAEIRLVEEGDVGVPAATEVGAVVGHGDDVDDFGVVGVALDERVRVELAEPAPERDLLVGGEVLIAEHEDVVFDERGADRGEGGGIDRCGEIEPADLGTEHAGDRQQVEWGRWVRRWSCGAPGHHVRVVRVVAMASDVQSLARL